MRKRKGRLVSLRYLMIDNATGNVTLCGKIATDWNYFARDLKETYLKAYSNSFTIQFQSFLLKS